MPELGLPGRARYEGDETLCVLECREDLRRVEGRLGCLCGMVLLVEASHEDLCMGVDGVARVDMVVACAWDGLVVGGEKEAEYSWGAEEMLHEDGREFDKVGRTAGSRDVLVLCSTDHS